MLNRFFSPRKFHANVRTFAACPTAILFLLTAATLSAADPSPQTPSKPLADLSMDGVENRFGPSSGQVTVARSHDAAAPGLVVSIQPGKDGYPGIRLMPDATGKWDLSPFGHVEARIVNTGAKQLAFALRVDNAAPNAWDTEVAYLKPGESRNVSVIFGFSYGHKRGYALKPAEVVAILLYAEKNDAEQSFRIESLETGGPAGEKPPVNPNDVRIKPKDGVLLGAGVVIDEKTQIEAKGAQVAMVAADKGPALRMTFAAGAKGDQSLALKPATGRWDLRDCLEVRVKLRNDGSAPIAPRVRLESNGGPSDWILATTSLAPGAAQEIVVPFASSSIWNGQKDTGTRFASDAASAVTVSVEHAEAGQTLLVESIKAGLPATPKMPDWLGQRPPVPGEWVKTFDDEFDGTAIDATKWNDFGNNYWDKTSHFSRQNVIVGGGVVRLRFEKKTGFQNDDPTKKRTDYATGFLETYGKWTQRYGYFEARVKLPTAPGLWPAFWTMPDRGSAGPQWQRQSTEHGAMEFDIMEHLTRWGPYRYNIAHHYDGYEKEHKSNGTDKIYVQPDKDGFITAGLLWTPGSAIYYANGREVLRWENARISDVPSDMMLTLPMGGWDNNELDDDQLPAEFMIDYVRVWQRKDLASEADGPKPESK